MLLAEELNARGLSAITRDERVRAFEQLHLPVAASLSHATVIKVGQLVGASEVIAGSFRLKGDELTVEAHGIRMDVGRLQPQVSEHAPLKDFFAIYQRIAQRLAMGAARLGPAPTPPPPGAFESYIKGLLAESAATQATFLEAALAEFPAFDQARLALWDVRYEQGDHAAALAAVKPVAATSPFAAARAAARRHLPARIEGFRDGGRHPHPAGRSEGAADHHSAARASRPRPQQPRHRPAPARCVGRCRIGDLLSDARD